MCSRALPSCQFPNTEISSYPTLRAKLICLMHHFRPNCFVELKAATEYYKIHSLKLHQSLFINAKEPKCSIYHTIITVMSNLPMIQDISGQFKPFRSFIETLYTVSQCSLPPDLDIGSTTRGKGHNCVDKHIPHVKTAERQLWESFHL